MVVEKANLKIVESAFEDLVSTGESTNVNKHIIDVEGNVSEIEAQGIICIIIFNVIIICIISLFISGYYDILWPVPTLTTRPYQWSAQ